jgi:3-phosphoshikimate 1-carboxyvinyltransferase
MDAREVQSLTTPIDAVVEVPGSKSITNRALVCAALAEGESRVERCAPGDDTAAMIECLQALGIAVEAADQRVVVRGDGGRLDPGPARLEARLAGTTSRFVTALAALGPGPYVVDGEPPLRRRPMRPLQDALRELGAHVHAPDGGGTLPVEIAGPARGGSVEVPGDISSQYITALMLIGPLLPEGVEIHLTSPLVSRPYVDMTAAVMREFGAHEVDIEPKRIAVRPGGYVATDYHVEPDASSASYPLALVALAGGRVRVPALTRDSLQGDVRFAELLGAMGCDVTWEPDGVSVSRPADRVLEGVDVDMADVSDLVPSLAVVAVIAGSPTRIRGVGFIRSKESDRLGDLAAELSTMGADIEVEPDGLLIRPAARPLHGTRLGTHHDHRLAMAFGVLGTVVPGVVVEEAGVVSKSWPGFWDALEHIVATG